MWVIYPAKKARFSKFSNKYYHIPGANSSFYKSHFIDFINIKLRLISNQLKGRKNLNLQLAKIFVYWLLQTRERISTFIVMYLLHLAHFVSSRRRMDDDVLGGMVGDVAGLLLLLDELVHVMLGPVLRGGDLEHVGGAEERLLRVPVGDHLQ